MARGEYLLANWERYRNYARGDLAHSTHFYGTGTYDSVRGEREQVRVTRATGSPEDVVRRANFNHLDAASIDFDEWRSDLDALVVPDAGEILFRLR
jgi:hypothetical protein